MLNKIQKFEDFIVQRDEKIKLIATCDEYKKQELNNVYSNNTKNLIMIGPEGDFSKVERQEILKFNGVQAIKINENILRSETAVISAISIINYAIN